MQTVKKARQQRKRPTLKAILQHRLLSGLLVVVPLSLTVFILRFLYLLTAGRLEPVTRGLFKKVPEYGIAFVSILILLSVTYGVGLIANIIVGRKIIALGEKLLAKIPLVNTVYSASKQVVQSLSFQDDSGSFQSVVIVDFPKPGTKSFAFVTSTMIIRDGVSGEEKKHYRVFIPTTPNPTSGYMEFIPVEQAEDAGISVEDAVTTVMSAGLVSPKVVGSSAPVKSGLLPEEQAHE
ncbi:MAG: DUF502 domain-containing protein [Candidatus Hydrogenedens sp.]|jgi:uncharacterized membrane protein|nr:DUF502 domain-containing protein [Candidatus Hydrogenedens sp.]